MEISNPKTDQRVSSSSTPVDGNNDLFWVWDSTYVTTLCYIMRSSVNSLITAGPRWSHASSSPTELHCAATRTLDYTL